jgi:hypothetical protein
LFKASNLSKVLPKVGALLAGQQVTAVKIEPRDVKVVGQNKVVTVDYNNHSFAVNAPAGLAEAAFGFGSVTPSGVEKAVSAFESKSGLHQSDIAYIAVARTAGFQQFASGATTGTITKTPFFLIFLRNSGAVYKADITGDHVTKVSSGNGGSGGGTAPSSATSSSGSTADCIAKAGTDVAKIQACVGK